MESMKDQQKICHATIVEYDLTSSEDELDEKQSYVYCSAKKLSPRPHQSWDEESQSSCEESQASAEYEEERDIKRPRLVFDLTPTKSELEMTASTPGGQTITISSSSEDDQKPVAAPSRKPYALRMPDLPPDLQRFLKQCRSFFTRPHSLERHGQHLATSTYMKAEERVLCFLGHVRRDRVKVPLTPEVFNSSRLIEAYLDFLKEDRRLSSATISNHASSLLYPLKYYHRGDAPRFADVPIISQLRKMATVLQKQGDLERTSTREDLQALNKWLDWDEVLEARNLQRSRFDLARGKREKAREACDLLLLSIYCHIPPGRGLEVRTLEVIHEAELSEPFVAARFRNRNVALMQKDGGLTIHVQKYKTYQCAGKDTIPIQVDTELCRIFKQFVADFRAELCPAQNNDYLFVNANGEPYSSGSFTKRLQRLFERLTGRQVSINVLRSSFLTWAYSQRDCDDAMKDSLAAALRHSREQAQATYDRRTATERKAAALELARQKAEEEPGCSKDTPAPPVSEPSPSDIGTGDFVGLVAEDSTLQKPSIFLGRVQAFLPSDQVCLLWYRNVGGGIYSLQVDGNQWVESRESLVPVEVAAAKGRQHAYRLRTSLRTIHKAVLDGGRDP